MHWCTSILQPAYFYSPMAAKLSNTIGATGVEHCTSCNSVGLKTTSERKERAMSSTTVFDVRDARYARVQERTVAAQRAVIGAGLSSEATIKAVLLLSGMQNGPSDQFINFSEARGACSFDVHEHVNVAPSHLLFFNLAGPLPQQVYNALSVLQKDKFVNDMRACSRYVPRHTDLKAFEPEKMGGTTLSMSDYAVLLTIAPTVLDDMHSETVLPALAVPVFAALKVLRAVTNALFFRPTNRNDGEHAVRCKPTTHTLQLLGCSLLNGLASLTSKGINWEKPSAHRVLELPYRTLPLVQIGPAICKLLFEKFHQVSKREIERSNSHDPAGFSMQRWRDVEMLSRVVAAPEKYGIAQEWLTDPNGQ